MTVAARSSLIVSPSVSTAAALERTLPPFCPSVVDDAISNWSALRRFSMAWCQALDEP